MHARYFSPNLGRFLSVDPVGGEVGSSQSWNRYTYVLNNPVTFVDPTGMQEDGEEELVDESFWKRLWNKIVGKAAPRREISDSDLQDAAELAEAAGLNPNTGQTRTLGLDGANAFADGTREAIATVGAEVSERVAYGVAFGVAGKSIRVLQSGGRSMKAATAKALGLEKRQAGRALERLKRFYGIPSDSHGKILSNGDYVDSQSGQVIDNILGFLE